MIEFRSESPEDTLALGRRLASLLTSGDVILLNGRLGAGKTLLASGIAEGLGVSGPVVSPSFVIARSYDDGFLPLVHADVYRLGSMAEFDDLELADSARDGVLLIEWGEAVVGGLPRDHLAVRIEIADASTRDVTIEPHGAWEGRSLEALG